MRYVKDGGIMCTLPQDERRSYYMGLYFALGLVGIAVDFYVAVRFKKIAEDKGYDSMEYLLVCFFLTFVGYIMVAALPDRKRYEMPAYNDNPGYAHGTQPVRPAVAAQPAAAVKPEAETKTVANAQPAAVQQTPVAPVEPAAQPGATEAAAAEQTPVQSEAQTAETAPKAQAVPVSPQISIAPDFELPVPEYVKRQEEAAAAAAAAEAAARCTTAGTSTTARA